MGCNEGWIRRLLWAGELSQPTDLIVFVDVRKNHMVNHRSTSRVQKMQNSAQITFLLHFFPIPSIIFLRPTRPAPLLS